LIKRTSASGFAYGRGGVLTVRGWRAPFQPLTPNSHSSAEGD
jgi:hypothetical protein